jgi:hypothetical protein
MFPQVSVPFATHRGCSGTESHRDAMADSGACGLLNPITYVSSVYRKSSPVSPGRSGLRER